MTAILPYKPAPRPMLAGAKLGQSSSLIREVAGQVVAQADPRARELVAQERSKLAEGLAKGLPWAVLGAFTALGTSYFVPKGKGQAVGYATALGLGGFAGWQSISALREEPLPPPSSEISPLTSLTSPVVRDMAQAIVEEAEPRIRSIVDDEKKKFQSALAVALPVAAAGAAAIVGTAYLVPDQAKVGKVVGYGASSALFLYALYRMVAGG